MAEVESRIEHGVCEIVLNRPPVNALNLPMIDALVDQLAAAGQNDTVRAVVVRSAIEGVFCAGLDLEVVRGADRASMRGFLQRLYIDLYDVQHELGKPTISVVGGAARAGGMTIAVSCDMVVAAERASFGYPEVRVGLLPALHFVHLPRHAGRHRAFDLLFTGRSIPAKEAYDLGLVSRLVATGKELATGRGLAAEFARMSPEMLRIGRDAFMDVNDVAYRANIEKMADVLSDLVESPDSQEGLTAFVEKRPPRWNS